MIGINRDVAEPVGEIVAIGEIEIISLGVSGFGHANAGFGAETGIILLAYEIDDAGNRVRSIECRRTARNNLDAVDKKLRDVVQIDHVECAGGCYPAAEPAPGLLDVRRAAPKGKAAKHWIRLWSSGCETRRGTRQPGTGRVAIHSSPEYGYSVRKFTAWFLKP